MPGLGTPMLMAPPVMGMGSVSGMATMPGVMPGGMPGTMPGMPPGMSTMGGFVQPGVGMPGMGGFGTGAYRPM